MKKDTDCKKVSVNHFHARQSLRVSVSQAFVQCMHRTIVCGSDVDRLLGSPQKLQNNILAWNGREENSAYQYRSK
eukprot:4101409-Amphidinium_carterae.1